MKLKNNVITLKEDGHYYYQIQGQIHITEHIVCYYFIYTSK